MIALPGEVACREVAPCASGTWGDIPVGSTTEHVDPTYTGMSDGSAQQPWTTIADAIAAAEPGAILALAAGTYAEDVVINKRVRLWGRCPSLVDISGASTGAAVFVGEGGSDAELRGLSISGAGSGLHLSDADSVNAEQLWVHDNPNRGVVLENSLLWMVGSLVERNSAAGIYGDNARVRFEESVMRDTLPDESGRFGFGIGVDADTVEAWISVVRSVIERNRTAAVQAAGAFVLVYATVVRDTLPDAMGAGGAGVVVRDPSGAQLGSLSVGQSLVERHRGAGVNVYGSSADIQSSVVRQTLADDQGLGGWGVAGQVEPTTGVGSKLRVTRSLVEDNLERGLFASGSSLAVAGVVVRGTLPNDSGLLGRGIDVEPSPDGLTPASFSASASVIEDNHGAGIVVSGGDALIDTTLVRGTQLDAGGEGGRGIAIQSRAGHTTTFDLFASLVEGNYEAAVSIVGADAVIREVEIRDTLPRADLRFGRGVNVQRDASLGAPASLTLLLALIEGSHEAGLAVSGAAAQIEKSIVRDSRASADGRFGDGVLVLANDAAATVTVVQSRIEASARAAISMFGAHVALGESRLVCQAFDLAGEPWNQAQSAFDDLDNNWCGCPTAQSACTLVSGGLEAPQALDPW
jgi:hypothetical protein